MALATTALATITLVASCKDADPARPPPTPALTKPLAMAPRPPPVTRALPELDKPASWTVSSVENAQANITAAGSGTQFAVTLTTANNSWADVFAPLTIDATAMQTLTFQIELQADVPTVLYVYLKHQDPAEACRFRVDVSAFGAGPRTVSLPLADPEWKTAGFSLASVAVMHLVVDDASDADAGRATLGVSGFQIKS